MVTPSGSPTTAKPVLTIETSIVPEPATVLLGLTGIATLAGLTRRRVIEQVVRPAAPAARAKGPAAIPGHGAGF